jgi:hypothetical protein
MIVLRSVLVIRRLPAARGPLRLPGRERGTGGRYAFPLLMYPNSTYPNFRRYAHRFRASSRERVYR